MKIAKVSHILKLRKSGDAEVAIDSAQNAGDAQKEGEELLRDVKGATVGYEGFWVELFSFHCVVIFLYRPQGLPPEDLGGVGEREKSFDAQDLSRDRIQYIDRTRRAQSRALRGAFTC